MRILHLGFEDYRRPWAGGGSQRTHAINRVLAQRHEVTVLCARYPGSRSRVDEGVRYEHIGLPTGSGRRSHYPSLLAYFAAAPAAVRRHRADLVVEDFAAPFGSIAVPWWTRTPTVGVVQWLFARQTARKYRLPFHLVESVGLRSHRRLIAVSQELGQELSRRNPGAQVTVIPNGLGDDLLTRRRTDGERRDLLYLGRLEIAQKGLDHLIEAFARIAGRIDADLVVAGDGADEGTVRAHVSRLGLDARVRFVGRVSGDAKADLLDRARALVVPSRYETFGIVAAEGMARGTPVIAYQIPCLRQVVPPGAGILIPVPGGRFAVGPLAAAMFLLSTDAELAAAMGARGPAAVQGLHWETFAAQQEAVYLDAVNEGRHG